MVFKSFFSKSGSYHAPSSSGVVPNSLSDDDDDVSSNQSTGEQTESSNNNEELSTIHPLTKLDSVTLNSPNTSEIMISDKDKLRKGSFSFVSSFGSKNNYMPSVQNDLLYYNKGALNVGQVMRFKISYAPPPGTPFQPNLHLKIKNLEVVALRAAYLAGPYILYVDVRPDHYDQNKKTYSQADRPLYEPQLKAGQSFYAPLYLNHPETDSADELSTKSYDPPETNPDMEGSDPPVSYSWTVDIVSQIIFSNSAQVQFEISIGNTQECLKSIPSHISKLYGPRNGLLVSKYDTLDLWHSPVPKFDPTNTNPVHLVILTHGLHSNTGADMLYVKESIDAAARQTGENVIVRGFFGNVRKTEKGVRYLGRRLADYVVKEASLESAPDSKHPPIRKISFIAHSLGGLVQTYALAHIATYYPDFFMRVKPVNFITLASPFLGISNENPYYVKFALDIGFVGKSGQDLSLMKPIIPGKKPLLRVLPTGPSHIILKMFERRTLYANAVNDGIVPLRTSAILYLDWRGLEEVAQALKEEHEKHEITETNEANESNQVNDGNDGNGTPHSGGHQNSEHEANTRENNEEVSEIPEGYQSIQIAELSNTSRDKEGLLSHISNAAIQPVQGIMSLFAPSSGHKKSNSGGFTSAPKIYKYSQTLPVSPDDYPDSHFNSNGSSLERIATEPDSEEDSNSGNLYATSNTTPNRDASSSRKPNHPSLQQKLSLPKKTSVFESGVSVLLPPLPPDSFILDPSSRPTTIVHDRYYHDYDMPPRRFKRRTATGLSLGKHKHDYIDGEGDGDKGKKDKLVERSRMEERIARDWHKEMSWRKVLVRLEPDAHNNIVVRRRFANAYGWPVIDHLVEEHFIKPNIGLYNGEEKRQSDEKGEHNIGFTFDGYGYGYLGTTGVRKFGGKSLLNMSPMDIFKSVSPKLSEAPNSSALDDVGSDLKYHIPAADTSSISEDTKTNQDIFTGKKAGTAPQQKPSSTSGNSPDPSGSNQAGQPSVSFGISQNGQETTDTDSQISQSKTKSKESRVNWDTDGNQKLSNNDLSSQPILETPSSQGNVSYSDESDSESDNERLLSRKTKHRIKKHEARVSHNVTENQHSDSLSRKDTNMSTTSTESSRNSERSDTSDDDYSTSSGNTETWDAYLYNDHIGNEDDGLLYQMGNMFDNIREIGNLNFAALGHMNNSTENLESLKSLDSKEGDISLILPSVGSKPDPSKEIVKEVDGNSSGSFFRNTFSSNADTPKMASTSPSLPSKSQGIFDSLGSSFDRLGSLISSTPASLPSSVSPTPIFGGSTATLTAHDISTTIHTPKPSNTSKSHTMEILRSTVESPYISSKYSTNNEDDPQRYTDIGVLEGGGVGGELM